MREILNKIIPKVSVLIPLYNCRNYIEEAIESVLNQTFKNFELIIVDNCSTDDSYELIQKYKEDHRVKIFQNETNIGMARNWNQCLLYAGGDYIKFLCADDYFRPDLLAVYVNVMDENSTVSLVTSRRVVLYGKKEEMIDIYFVGLKSGKEVYNDTILNYINPIGEPTTVMFRRKHLYAGMFNADLHWMTDIDYWLRLCREGDVYFLENTYCVFRQHEQQGTALLRNSDKLILEERDMMYYNIFIRDADFNYDFHNYFRLIEAHLKKNFVGISFSLLNKYLNPFFISKSIKLNFFSVDFFLKSLKHKIKKSIFHIP
ncbi:MAG TPA: glycosyltransferase family 2 protein [Mucilaginibacter sp.]|jgi:glycosyltransferase involved in cell wall biosynthesis|nr:glycosyltransferase family 2 protein [Mucilaginibacter sp.]